MIVPRGGKLIKIDVYDCEVILLLNQSQTNSFLKINGVEKAFHDSGCRGTATKMLDLTDDSEFYVLTVTEHNLGVLVHECVHIAHFILDDREIPISIENSEVEAFLVEHIFNEARKHIKELKL